MKGSRVGSNHGATIMRIVVLTLLVLALCEAIAWFSQGDLQLRVSDHWAIACYSFFIAWWVVYFRSLHSKLPSLRLFLGQYSAIWRTLEASDTSVSYDELTESMNTKCASSIQVQGIYIAIISLLLVFVTQVPTPTPFQEVLVKVAITTAFMAILLLVITSDILDTASNRFLVQVSHESWSIKRHFYRGINPPGIDNGYAYYGFVLFLFFIIVSISLIWPPLVGVGIAVHGYFGYPYWFGYKRVQLPDGEFRIDSDATTWPSVVLGAFFLLGTIVFTTFF